MDEPNDFSTKMDTIAASVPEPPPKNEGIPVTPELLLWLEEISASPKVSELIIARYQYGLQKYGQTLKMDEILWRTHDKKPEIFCKARLQGSSGTL